jgi:hypothetical protein
MEIAPSFRGRGLGLKLLGSLEKSPFLPNSCLVGLQPWAMGHKDNSKAGKIGTKKLHAYWCKAGYQEVEDGEYLWNYFP